MDYSNLHGLTTEIISKTDDSNILYRTLLENKKREYDTLYASYQNFRKSTASHLDSINTNILKVNGSLTESNQDLDSIKSNLDKAIKDISAAKGKQFWNNMKWGAIGFGLAILVVVATK